LVRGFVVKQVAGLLGGGGHAVATLFSSYYSPFLTPIEGGTRLSEAESENNATKKKKAIVRSGIPA
jgi:hypothetical protein